MQIPIYDTPKIYTSIFRQMYTLMYKNKDEIVNFALTI